MTLTFFNYRIKSKCDDFMLKILMFSNSIFYIFSNPFKGNIEKLEK